MTRQEVIDAFPPPVEDIRLLILWSALACAAAIIALHRLVNSETKTGAIVSIITFLAAIIFMISFSYPRVIENRKLPELRGSWVQNIFEPYVANLDKVKIQIFDAKWNEKGEIDILLDTNDYKKNFNGITEFQYYDSADPNDHGYVYIQDLGNLDDFPEEAKVKKYFNSIELAGVYLPKRFINNK